MSNWILRTGFWWFSTVTSLLTCCLNNSTEQWYLVLFLREKHWGNAEVMLTESGRYLIHPPEVSSIARINCLQAFRELHWNLKREKWPTVDSRSLRSQGQMSTLNSSNKCFCPIHFVPDTVLFSQVLCSLISESEGFVLSEEFDRLFLTRCMKANLWRCVALTEKSNFLVNPNQVSNY